MKTKLLYLFVLIFSIILIQSFHSKMLASAKASNKVEEEHSEILYLPNGNAIKIISANFDNALADFFWMTTINYFGKHYKGDKSYKWLKHRCSLIQDLNPLAEHVIEFCGLILAFEANDAKGAREILQRAVTANPNHWRYPYLIGMNYLLFEKNNKAARDYFIISAKTPNAMPFVTRLAAKQSIKLSEPTVALDFLEEMIKSAKDENQRNSFIEQYKKILSTVASKKN